MSTHLEMNIINSYLLNAKYVWLTTGQRAYRTAVSCCNLYVVDDDNNIEKKSNN